MAKVYIETYGCTLNQADSDIIKALLKEHRIVDSEEDSDVIILNSCAVKGTTENKIMHRIESLAKQKKKIVISGCLTSNVERLRKSAPDAPIVGTSSLKSVVAAVDDALHGRNTVYKTFESKDELPKLLTAPIMRIPINDGCVSSCHFCQTKLARPFLRSYSPKTITRWIDESISNGAREIQLTSMDSGAYGIDIKTDLIALLDGIANYDSSWKTDREFLVRIGMINPNHAKRMLPKLLEMLGHKRFYKFLHVPVQTGSEKVCREMNRDHTVQDFVDIVEAVRKKFPEATIATDIIVGYPTETEQDFEKTLELLEKTGPDVVNVSKFSARPGTKAQKLKQLPSEEVKRRSTITANLVRSILEKRRKALVGRKYRVLITEKDPDYKGRNINYQQVVVKDFKGNLGEYVDVEIADANHGSLFGMEVRK